MSLQSDLRNFVAKYGSEYQNIQTVRLGKLDGVTVETGTPGLLWARQWNGKEIRVHNRALVPSDFDLRVLVGTYRTQPNNWFILQSMEDYLTPAAGGRVAYHHEQHMFGAADMLPVDRKQVMQLTAIVSDAAGFIVSFYGGMIRTATGIQIITNQSVDLSSYVPADGAIYANIECNNSGTLFVETGTAFASPLSGDVSYIAVPGPGNYLLAVVLLYAEQEELLDEHIAVPMPMQVSGGVASGLGWFNVVDYGATGDGVTNDTGAITSAISALTTAGGGVLYFPPGVYLTSGGYTLAVNCTVLGCGKADFYGTNAASEIQCNSATAVLFTVTADKVLFENLALTNTNATPSAGAGIKASSSNATQEVCYEGVSVYGFYDNVDVQVGNQWYMHGCYIAAPVRYGVRVRNTVLPDAGDWSISDSVFVAEVRNATAGIRIETSGGGKIVNVKTNGNPHRFTYGIDVSGSGTTGIILIANSSFENIITNAIHVSTWDILIINGCQAALYTSTGTNAISLTSVNYFVIDDCVLIGNSPSTAAAAISLNTCTFGAIGLYETRFFTSALSQSSCTNITTLASVSSATPADVGSAGAAGSGTAASKDDHVHKGVHSLAVLAGTALYGDVTLSAGTNITLTRSSNDISIAATSSGSSGAGQVAGVARWVSAGGTTFDLPDVAEDLMNAFDNGSLVDPTIYSLSSDKTQIVFDSSITAAHIVVANYIVAQV